MTALAFLALALALLPAGLALANLLALRRKPGVPAPDGLVSILIPARNEAGNIGPTLAAALASTGVPIEVIVADDHSTDGTAAIVAGIAARDPRLRLVPVPPLPPGWTGKNHACHVLGQAATGRHLLFIDADVRLAPHGAAIPGGRGRGGRRGPRQRRAPAGHGTWGERLTVPMINFLLLGYLPIPLMRRLRDPALGAACGQLVLVEADAYRRVGGHGAIRASLHDGVRLPRIVRQAGLTTDLVAAADLATSGCTRISANAGPASRRTPMRAWRRPGPAGLDAVARGRPRPAPAPRRRCDPGRRQPARRRGSLRPLPDHARGDHAFHPRRPLDDPASSPHRGVGAGLAMERAAAPASGGVATWKGRTYPAG